MTQTTQPSDAASSNPFFEPWDTPFGVPPFERMKPEHFMPAYRQAFAEHEVEVAKIAGETAPPTFDNTIVALENSGRTLQQVDDVFHQLAGTMSNDALLEIERDISPLTAAHWSKVRLNGALFARIDALHRGRAKLGLSPEQMRVLERYHTTYRRNGAALDAEGKTRLAAISERLATLGTAFSQNVLADEQSYALILDSESDLDGLPDFVREAASAAAQERGHNGKHAVTLQRSSVEPFLQFSSRRDLREKAFRAWQTRGDNNDKSDNKAIIAETLKLRAERAKLLGYKTFAQYRLDDAMAKTPENVRGLLEKVWAPARKSALADRDDMQEIVREEGGNFKLAPWDWRYYADKLRQRRCNFEEAAVKPYMALDKIIDAAFYTAGRLFGVSFHRIDIPVWHPDVRAWEVKAADGAHVGIFYGDYFARSSKHSGAWMSTFRDQQKLSGDVRPVALNVMNFNKGDPTLLSFDDARTLFHEFGHALHGLLSNVTYPQVSGTSVLTDWVELPSQLFEHWFEQPEILSRFARHVKTGEPMPTDLLDRLLAARNFDKGRETVEYIASAMVDLDMHSRDVSGDIDINALERETLAKMQMPDEIVMRHRPPHFTHVFSGGYYASAYYSYMWSETLDADAFAAFEETGDIFNPAVAKKLEQHVLSAGGSRDPAELYVAFRGRLPNADALLKKRGFADAVA